MGLSTAELGDLRQWRTSDWYDEVDQLVLEYVEESTIRHRVSDDLYRRLASAFSTRQIADLCFTASLASMINRFHATFLTELDKETADHPDVPTVAPALSQPAGGRPAP